MNERQQKGLEIAATMKIERLKRFTYSVPSQTTKRTVYTVTERSCTCPDYELRQEPCKHVWAVDFYLKRETVTDEDGNVSVTETQAVRVTYGQDWAAYNTAQTTEKGTFLALLHDLCGTVEEPEQHMGRPRIPLHDAIFSACFKVYSGFSGRRFMTDMREAQAEGYVAKAPSYNSIFRVIEDESVTPVLFDLIERSAAPLAEVETTFAADSTGFGATNFFRYYSAKYGSKDSAELKAHDWVKLHAMVGTKTNVVTAVTIKSRNAHDGNQLPDLVERTAETFTMLEVSADKAYSSRDNLEAIEAVGARPFIPFRANARAHSAGRRRSSTWEKLFHFYSYKRDEFLAHYHKRSNVEATFSAIKRKFGGNVRSKTPVAQVNEVLLKILAHNVVCLVHSMHELGVDPQF